MSPELLSAIKLASMLTMPSDAPDAMAESI
jgi:hypothetical protein